MSNELEAVPEVDLHDPAQVEQMINHVRNRIAKGVGVIRDADDKARSAKRKYDLAMALAMKHAEGPEYMRKAEAVIATMDEREEAENADLAFRHAVRTAESLEKGLFALQSILNSVRAMYGAAGVGVGR